MLTVIPFLVTFRKEDWLGIKYNLHKVLKKVNFHLTFNGVWFCCRIINLYLKELGQILVKRRLKTSFLNMRLTLIFISLVLKFGSIGQRQCCSKYCFLLCSVMKGFWQYFQTAMLRVRMGRKRGWTEFQQSLSSRALLSRYNNIIAVIVFWTHSWSERQTYW